MDQKQQILQAFGKAWFIVSLLLLTVAIPTWINSGTIVDTSISNILRVFLCLISPLLALTCIFIAKRSANRLERPVGTIATKELKGIAPTTVPEKCPRCGKSLGLLHWRGWNSQFTGCRSCSHTIKFRIRKSFQAIHNDGDLSTQKLALFKEAVAEYEVDNNVVFALVRKDILNVFRQSFLRICANGVAPVSKLGQLQSTVAAYDIETSEALAFVHKDALNLFRQAFLRLYEDSVTSATKSAELEDLARAYKLDMDQALSFVRADAHGILRNAFLRIYNDTSPYPTKLSTLRRTAGELGIPFDQALAVVRKEALQLLLDIEQAQITANFTDSGAEQEMRQLQSDLGIPYHEAQPVFDRFTYRQNIANIKRGVLPKITPSNGMYLESDEECHFETSATYHKTTSAAEKLVYGRLVATNKKLRFLSDQGGFEINWNRVMRIERRSSSIYLELSTKTGQGQYDVRDVELAEAVLDVLVRIAKRQVVSSPSRTDNRHIPQDVKAAVWQRDKGRCVQCGVTANLQFDHIIPFSKGGSNSERNIQLLCQTCNLAKRDRI